MPSQFRQPRWLSAWLVVPLIIGAVLISRIPAISVNDEFNVDESGFVAQALRCSIDPVPWRGVDGTTSGPINSWLLYLLHRAGMPLGYRCLHTLAAAMLAALCVLTYTSLRQVAGRVYAAVGGAVAVVFVVLAQTSFDFCHYTSELIPALLASGTLLCVALRPENPRHRTTLDGLAAVLLGFMPWTKLQSVIGAGVLGLSIGWLIFDDDDSAKIRRVALFSFLAAVPTLIVLGPVVYAGAWDDFWMSYMKANAAYAGGTEFGRSTRPLGAMLWAAKCTPLVAGTVLFAAVWLLKGRSGWRAAGRPVRQLMLVSAAVSAASLVEVLKPRDFFDHYSLLLFQPLSLVAACLLSIWSSDLSPASRSQFPNVLFAIFLFGLQLRNVPRAIGNARETWSRRAPAAVRIDRQILEEIHRVAPSARIIAIWGWMPRLYVETGTPPPTRHVISHFLIEPSPARDHLRSTFLADIEREKPEVIVDAVADGCFRWSDWDSRSRIDSFREFADYVHQNYRLASEKHFVSGPDPVRVYVLATRGNRPLP